MPREMPTCGKCGFKHWLFKRCDQIPEVVEHRRKTAEPVAVKREGWKLFGDQMGAYLNLGGNLVLDRPIVQGKNVIPDPEWGWGHSDVDSSSQKEGA